MKKLKIDLGELMYILDDASWETNRYLDLETGQLMTIFDETRHLLERIYEEEYDPDAEASFDLVEVIKQRGLPEWQQEALLEADQIEALYGSRYVGVPNADSHEGYRDMENFILTVQDEDLQNRLWRAISGRGAFRYFKDVLYDHHRERERWFTFKDDRLRQRAVDWLASQGIEPIVEPPPVKDTAPSPRSRLIAEALLFVRAASQLPGVLRIALIGSLTTDEPDPKDVDMLVTVTDEMDLTPLATLGRKLQGHAQSFNRGGEVFLADPQGNYIGRTCPWKHCGPGIRMSCDALHCGRRPYLHDDLETIRLDEALIAAPPVALWPELVVRGALPEDVEQGLIAPLREPG